MKAGAHGIESVTARAPQYQEKKYRCIPEKKNDGYSGYN
jgi:hypothetical protein